MQRLFRSIWWLVVAGTLALSPAHGADRNITLLPGTDLPGFDYLVLKDVDVDACSAACTDDKICRAFTFNEKANWCFLKGDAGPETAFKGATSGRIDFTPPLAQNVEARLSELPFPAQDLVDSARYMASSLPQTDPPPPDVTYADLVAAGDEASAQSNPSAAMVSYRQALAINRNDPSLWLKLAAQGEARAVIEAAAGNGVYDLAVNVVLCGDQCPAAVRNSRRTRRGSRCAGAGAWPVARCGAKRSRPIAPASRWSTMPTCRRALDQTVAEHGFRVTSNQVDAEAATPRICAVVLRSAAVRRHRPFELCRGRRRPAGGGRDRAEPDLHHRRRAWPALPHQARAPACPRPMAKSCAPTSSSTSMCPTARRSSALPTMPM